MVAEPLAAEVLITEAFVLQHDAHGPVEDHDPLPEQLIQSLSDRRCHGHGDP
jgi:hypothetical protein